MLEVERRALLAGDFSRLPELAAEKERLAGRLSGARVGQKAAPRLRAALRRNQRLLEAALKGLSAVQLRLGTRQMLMQQMETYGPTGRRTSIGRGPTGKIREKF